MLTVIMYIISCVSHNYISKGLHVELKGHAVFQEHQFYSCTAMPQLQ